MSTEQEDILAQSTLDLGKLKFQEEIIAESKKLGLIKDDESTSTDSKTEPTSTDTRIVDERQFSDVEKEQMAKGWDPDKPDGVSAVEFKRVGEIIEAKRTADKKAKSATSEVQELTKTVKALVDHNRKLEKASYDKALRDLEIERDNKVLEGDLQAVKDLDLKEQVLQKAKESVDLPIVEEPVKQEYSRASQEYLERNKFWMTGESPEDVKMQILGNTVIDYLKKTAPNISEEDAIKTIEKEVKEKFPHRFDNPNKDKPASVLTSTSNNDKKTNLSYSSLSYQEKVQLANIQKVDPSFTMKEYVKQLETIGRR